MICLSGMTQDEIIKKPPAELIHWSLDIYHGNRFFRGKFKNWSQDPDNVFHDGCGNSFSWGEIMGCFYMRQMPGFQWIAAQLEAGQQIAPWIFRD